MAVTMKDIAQAAGVSVGTVDRALHDRGRIDADVRERVLRIAAELGYIPNAAAQQLHAKKMGRKLGVLMPFPRDLGFWHDLETGIREAAEDCAINGVTVLVDYFQQFDTDMALDKLRALMSKEISGLAAVPFTDVRFTDALREINASGIPVMLINNPVDELSESDYFCYVGSNYEKAGATAAGLAYRFLGDEPVRALHVYNSFSLLSQRQRIAGFEKELMNLPAGGRVCAEVELSKIRKEPPELIIAHIRSVLEAHPEINLVYTTGGNVSWPAEAVGSFLPDRKLRHIAFDLNAISTGYLRDGRISALISQEAVLQGYLPIRLLYDRLAKGSLPPAKNIYMRNEIIIAQNLPSVSDLTMIDFKSLYSI